MLLNESFKAEGKAEIQCVPVEEFLEDKDLLEMVNAGIYESNFKDAHMDTLNKGLFCFASYNAGPAKIKELRQKAEERGFDPNVWFDNVERIAAEEIGRETVQYVSNIYKYYVAYTLVQR